MTIHLHSFYFLQYYSSLMMTTVVSRNM